MRLAARQTLAGQVRLLEQLRRQIAQATKEFRRQVRGRPTAKLWDSLPGIGSILAYTITAEVGDPTRFANSKKLTRYALLAPLAEDSGEESGEAPLGRHVGHLGRLTLKWAFIEAAHAAVRKSRRLRQVFDRYTNQGQSQRNRGYIAVARQLCHIGLACVKKKTPYREEEPPRRPGSVTAPASPSEGPAQGQPQHPMARPSRRRCARGAAGSAQA